jgi:hypothetical protein
MGKYLKFMLMWCRNSLQNEIAFATNLSLNTMSAWCEAMRESSKITWSKTGKCLEASTKTIKKRWLKLMNHFFFAENTIGAVTTKLSGYSAC